MNILKWLAIAGFIVVLPGCSNPAPQPPQPGDTAKRLARVECTEPRPEICHKALRPVCATRDNGVRCVTTPCDSTDEVTYPNECLACADPAVYGYREGACSAEPGGG